MAKVTGFGGVFYKVADPAATRAWYRDRLGIPVDDHGWHFHWRAKADDTEGMTVLSPFRAATEYFAPSDKPFMLNLMVDDLDAVLATLAADGIVPVGEVLRESYGHFAAIVDPDGVKVELWQPIGPFPT